MNCLDRRGFVSALALCALSVPIATSSQTQDEQQQLTVYATYLDAVQSAGKKLLSIHKGSSYYTGYSLLPFGSREKAVKEALGFAAKSTDTVLIVTFDATETYRPEAPPPGSFMGGVYSVYRLLPIKYIDLTTQTLLTEIKAHVGLRITQISEQHIKYLTDVARSPDYKGLTPEYKALVRAGNNEYSDGFALSRLVQLIELHEGKSCAEELIRWAKFHKNSQVRHGAYTSLISLGKHAEVEEILKTEENKAVKQSVQDALI
ncbi:MAG: hypothetical protein ACK4F8_01605 [Aquabacterium sp.]